MAIKMTINITKIPISLVIMILTGFYRLFAPPVILGMFSCPEVIF